MSYSDIFPSSSVIMYGSSFNIGEDGLKFDFSTYNTAVQGGQPLICSYLRTDNTFDYCQVQHYYKSGSYWRAITVNNGFGSSFLNNLNSWSGFDVPASSNSTAALVAKLDPNTFSLVGFQWGGLPNTNSTRNIVQYHSVYVVDSSSDNPVPDNGSFDLSGVINAILMIPAVLLVLGAFTIIYRMFINRRVRG